MEGSGIRKIWKDGKPTVGVLFFFLSEKVINEDLLYELLLFFFVWESLFDVSKQVQVNDAISQ